MMTQAIKDVLSFQAFRPDADDSNAQVEKRMDGKRYLIINISRSRVSWKSVDRKGKFDQSGDMKGDFLDVAGQMAEEWRSMTDGGWVVLSINNRFIITQEANLSRKPGAESIIRNNPKSIIGAKYDRSRRYSLYHHPETSASLLLACEESMLQSYEESLGKYGLKAARICCGLFAMTEEFLRQRFAEKEGGDFVLLACCDGSALVLASKNGQWSDLRSRSGLYADQDIEPLANLAGPVLGGAEEGCPIFLLHDEKESEFAEVLYEQLKESGAKSETREDRLWTVIGKN
ncbi:MAG: hypothetical protein AAF357_03175 [Verrucomicrobiota bacterium]